MNDQGTDWKVVADRLGHTLDVNQQAGYILWSGVRDSNPCKSAWKADAQPLGQPRHGTQSGRSYSNNAAALGASSNVRQSWGSPCPQPAAPSLIGVVDRTSAAQSATIRPEFTTWECRRARVRTPHRVARQQSASPLHRCTQHAARRGPGSRGHFYFALTGFDGV
jgi:hypothetical protein